MLSLLSKFFCIRSGNDKKIYRNLYGMDNYGCNTSICSFFEIVFWYLHIEIHVLKLEYMFDYDISAFPIREKMHLDISFSYVLLLISLPRASSLFCFLQLCTLFLWPDFIYQAEIVNVCSDCVNILIWTSIGLFASSLVAEVADGSSNVREVWKLHLKWVSSTEQCRIWLFSSVLHLIKLCRLICYSNSNQVYALYLHLEFILSHMACLILNKIQVAQFMWIFLANICGNTEMKFCILFILKKKKYYI